jgi:hypothetical protein
MATNANKSPQHAEPACADESDAQIAARPMARELGDFNIEPPATPESTPSFKDVREPKRLKPDIIRPPSRTEQYKSCAMERNSVRVSDGRLLAIKVIAAVIGTVGIALLAFPDPMRKSVDSFGRIKPSGSPAHLAIENQKGLTSEPLPLGISVADGSGGETVTVAGLAEGTELSLGTVLESGNWLVPVADLDKTFVGAPMSFVGVMTVKVTLNSATGKHLDTRNIRFEWGKPEFYSAPPAGQTEPTRGSTSRTSGRTEPTPAPAPIQSPPVSETAESFAAPLRPDPSSAPAANCLTSADEVRRLAPKAWPKWTYGPHGERCWYSGRKPVFQKEMPAQVEVIPAPLSDDTRSQAGSNKTQLPACLASATEVRKLTPNAWPKWTYGPNGERCWYSGEKPVFAKTR